MAVVLPSDANAGNGVEAVDRRALLQTLSIAQQWRLISSQPRVMRLWHMAAALGTGTLVLVVYGFGWRRHGASWLMVTPAMVYALNAYITVAVFNTVGMINPINILGPVNGALQMYFMVYPLFQAVSKVWHLTRKCTVIMKSTRSLTKMSGNKLLLQKPFGSTIVHLAAIGVDSFLTVILATSTLEAMSPVAGKLLNMRSDVLWRGAIQVLRMLDSATDLEVSHIFLTQACPGCWSTLDATLAYSV